jgi:hypothetical protein
MKTIIVINGEKELLNMEWEDKFQLPAVGDRIIIDGDTYEVTQICRTFILGKRFNATYFYYYVNRQEGPIYAQSSDGNGKGR